MSAAYVSYYYVDQSYNGVDWEGAFQEALKASRAAESGDEVRRGTAALLNKLGDPYSRVLPPASAAKFQAEDSGKARARAPIASAASSRGCMTMGRRTSEPIHRHYSRCFVSQTMG